MKPSARGEYAAAVTRAKGKMFEYRVPLEDHITIPDDLVIEQLFPPAIGTLGDYAADYVSSRLGQSAITDTAEVELKFYANILAAYAETRRADELSPQLYLLSAAGYYLSGMPGNSVVMLGRISKFADPALSDISRALVWILDKPWFALPNKGFGPASQICAATGACIAGTGTIDNLLEAVGLFRSKSYDSASPTDLLAGDLLCAIAICRVANSARQKLPGYSLVPASTWESYFERPAALRELWPSQQMLGDAGVYAGTSAVIQMPTSAGKTKAIELVIRSAFISERTNLAVVVAPFRALCEEITQSLSREFSDDGYLINQLTDSIQPDFLDDLSDFIGFLGGVSNPQPGVVIATPEKLLYVLRQRPELVHEIGLIIYDEGHQFDTGTRGVTYELLITAIRQIIRDTSQVVLISAVIQNPEALAGWLLPISGRVVSDHGAQTERNLAFASWRDSLGQLRFYDPKSLEESFFVPRVLVEERLGLRGRERTPRIFPNKEDASSVALYLATKLVDNGAVAIFCGTKPSVSKLIRDGIDVFDRGTTTLPPSAHANEVELGRLVQLYRSNFGADSYLTKAATLGLFGHHGDTPHGIRLAVEHAIRVGLIKFLVCTSTLAQGVNLPIRYLLVTATRQGGNPIRTRDFHNLMGRAGRAGIHGEGTVIFTDPKLFDQRTRHDGSWRWRDVKNILRPENSEPTSSTLLTVLDLILSRDGSTQLGGSPLELVTALVSRREAIVKWAANPPDDMVELGFTSDTLLFQINSRLSVIRSIESFLMSQREDISTSEFVSLSRRMARETFAYHLAGESERAALEEVFSTIAVHIEHRVPDLADQKRFGRTLLGVDESLEVDRWAAEHLMDMLGVNDNVELLGLIWPMLETLATSSKVTSSRPEGVVLALAEKWLAGADYDDLHSFAELTDAEYPYGARWRKYSIDDVVGLCEQSFGYEQQLFLATLAESVLARVSEYGEPANSLYKQICSLQKCFKYGLSSDNAIRFYEAGFSERIVAKHLASRVTGSIATQTALVELIKRNEAHFVGALVDCPAYFKFVLANLLTAPE